MAFKSIPFLRILVPFVPGTLVGVFLEGRLNLLPWLLLSFVFSVWLFRKIAITRKSKIRFLAAADIFLFLLGLELSYAANQQNTPRHYSHFVPAGSEVTLAGYVNDIPAPKSRTLRCELRLTALDTGTGPQKVSGSIYVYFKKSLRDSLIQPGRGIWLRARLQQPAAPANPGQFDYARYLRRKQIFHMAFADSLMWMPATPASDRNSLWLSGLRIKQAVLHSLRKSGLSPEANSIAAALLTGYDDEIDREVLKAFSHTGTLHVLSVSGLHTGLIYLALVFVWRIFDKAERHRRLRLLLVSLVLWSFALMTGFSAPVLRAVIMLSLLGIGSLYFHSSANNSVNILSVAAFALLVYDPYLICDVGFLLSFLALAGIFYFQPLMQAWWEPSRASMLHVWQNITVSCAATLSTLPVTLCFFNQFPLWFFLCNLVVVPLTFVILLLSLLVLLHLPASVFLVNLIVKGLILFIGLFGSETYAYLDNIDFDKTDAVMLSLLIVLLSLAFRKRSFYYTRTALLLLILWQLISLSDSFFTKKTALLTVYQVKNQAVHMVKRGTGVYLSAEQGAGFEYETRAHLLSLNYPVVKRAGFNYVACGRHQICFLRFGDRWPAEAQNASVLVLSQNSALDVDALGTCRRLRTVIADGSNNMAALRRSAELCRKFGIEFISTRDKGAFLLKLQ